MIDMMLMWSAQSVDAGKGVMVSSLRSVVDVADIVLHEKGSSRAEASQSMIVLSMPLDWRALDADGTVFAERFSAWGVGPLGEANLSAHVDHGALFCRLRVEFPERVAFGKLGALASELARAVRGACWLWPTHADPDDDGACQVTWHLERAPQGFADRGDVRVEPWPEGLPTSAQLAQSETRDLIGSLRRLLDVA